MVLFAIVCICSFHLISFSVFAITSNHDNFVKLELPCSYTQKRFNLKKRKINVPFTFIVSELIGIKQRQRKREKISVDNPINKFGFKCPSCVLQVTINNEIMHHQVLIKSIGTIFLL